MKRLLDLRNHPTPSQAGGVTFLGTLTMIEWQVEEEGDWPITASEEYRSKRVFRWRRWGGVLLLLMVAGVLLFHWRLSEREEAMRADLKTFIRHEEQQRLFGFTEQADKLMVSDAPKEWQEAYLSTFVKADEVQPASVEVEEIELQEGEAYVTLRLNGKPQVRFYRLVGQKWQRAPLFGEFEGKQREIELADERIRLLYPADNEVFVERVVAKLPSLVAQWPMKKGIDTIEIAPQEFWEALFEVEESRIVLNSQVLMMQEETDGQTGLQLALADALLEEVNANAQTEPLLSGTTLFSAAIRTIFILRWGLPDEVIPRQIWREKVQGFWKSPFLSEWNVEREEVSLARVWEPHLSEAAVLLMADYLYGQIGSEGLGHLMAQLPTAQSWDSLFYPLTGYYTVELEDQVRLAHSETKTVVPPPPELPLHVTLLDMDLDEQTLLVKSLRQDEELSIKMTDSTLRGLQGTISHAHCAALHKQLTITEGDWLVVGEELQARKLAVSRSSPSISLPADTTQAPPDTFAYLAERRFDPEHGSRLHSFIALSEEGGVTHLTTLPPLMTLGSHVASKTPWPARFLLTLSVPECEQAWVFMYDPMIGIVYRWLTSFPDLSIFRGSVWLPFEGQFVLSRNKREDQSTTALGEPSHSSLEFSRIRYPLSSYSNQLVTLDEERKNVNLIDLTLGEVSESIALSSEDADFFMLSQDEKHLLYAYAPAAKKQAFRLIDLEQAQDDFLFSTSEGERLQPVIGGTSADHLLLLRTAEKTEPASVTQLLLIDLKVKDHPTIVMEIPFEQHVTSALACADERVLVAIYDGQQTEVWQWQPTGGTKRLLKMDKQLQLLSCR